MGISHGGIGQKELLLILDPFHHRFRTAFVQDLFCAAQVIHNRSLWNHRHVKFYFLSLGLIYDNFAKIIQNPIFFVSLCYDIKKLRVVCDKSGVAFSLQECLVI